MANALKCPKTHVIACDLDDSLVATQSHPEQSRRRSDEALRQIGTLITALRVQSDGAVYFGSATGRTFDSIQELAAKRPAFGGIFRMMDFHIASVGAAIYTGTAAGFRRVSSWPHNDAWNRTALVDQLSLYPELMPQEPAAQDTYKISYTTNSTISTAAYAKQLTCHLGIAGLQADIVVSGSGPHRFVDVLPIGVNKGSALLQIPQSFEKLRGNPTVPEICRIAAGDSMNDQGILAVANVSIIPGNGQPDLLAWAETNQTENSVHITDKYFAAGVLQGLRRHLYSTSHAASKAPQTSAADPLKIIVNPCDL